MPEILLDAAPILGHVEETPWGFLKIPARLGAEGVVTYTLKDGSKRREYRPASEILSLDSLKSYESAPVSGRHPYDEPSQLLLPENIKKHFAGVVGDTVKGATVDGIAVVDGWIMLMDEEEINLARAGKVALSPGYTRRLEMTPGVWTNPKTGEKVAYDAIQRDIRVNHVVTCAQGRQGPLVRLLMDSLEGDTYEFTVNLDAVEVERIQKPQGGRKMKIKIGGVEYEVADAVAARLDSLEGENGTLKAQVGVLTTEKKTALDSVAAAEGRADAAKSAQKTAEDALAAEKGKAPALDSIPVEQLHAAADKRVRVVTTAKAILPKDQHAGLSKLSDGEIMKKVVALDSPDTPATKLDQPAYVEARFDSIVEQRAKAGKDDAKAAAILSENRVATDADCGGGTDRAAARAARKAKIMADSCKPLPGARQ